VKKDLILKQGDVEKDLLESATYVEGNNKYQKMPQKKMLQRLP